jgi:hypothetical protein
MGIARIGLVLPRVLSMEVEDREKEFKEVKRNEKITFLTVDISTI